MIQGAKESDIRPFQFKGDQGERYLGALRARIGDEALDTT